MFCSIRCRWTSTNCTLRSRTMLTSASTTGLPFACALTSGERRWRSGATTAELYLHCQRVRPLISLHPLLLLPRFRFSTIWNPMLSTKYSLDTLSQLPLLPGPPTADFCSLRHTTAQYCCGMLSPVKFFTKFTQTRLLSVPNFAQEKTKIFSPLILLWTYILLIYQLIT